jgi:hypothetical protein
MNKAFIAIVLTILATFFSANVKAHEMSMAELEIRQFGRGDFQWQWVASGLTAVAPLKISLTAERTGLTESLQLKEWGKAIRRRLCEFIGKMANCGHTH